MMYTVVTTERAAREIEAATAWWAKERSVEQAQRWFQGIRAAIAGLSTSPERCPIVAEQNVLPYEVRELHYGIASRPTHRVVFTILRQTVVVLTIRHTSRGDLRPEAL